MTRWAARLLVLLMLVPLAGCAMRVTPPTEVAEPVAVHLLDHGRHTSLLLPTDSGMVRYTFGDWRWYAEDDTGAWRGFRALLTPSSSAFGRAEVEAETLDGALRRFRVGYLHRHAVEVEREQAEALRRELDARHAEAERHTYSRRYNLDFAGQPDAYHLINNSNSRVAEWLEAMGCEVSGPRLYARWHVEEPAP